MKNTWINKQNGHTIIEALMTIVIIGIFSTLAIPTFNSANVRARVTVRQVVADMRFARSMAITESSNYVVEFTTNGYSIYKEGSESTPVKTKAFSEQVSFSGTTEVTFQPFGNAASDGTIVLAVDGNDKYNVNVTANTGRVIESSI